VGLQITTTLSATGDVGVPVAFGYHPHVRPRLPVRRRGLVAGARGVANDRVRLLDGYTHAQLFAPGNEDFIAFDR
jgi:hypothetical protein